MNKLLKNFEKLYIYILLVIFGGIILHAPISVGLGVLLPDYELLIKSWKEILMLLAGLVLLAILYKTKRFSILKEPLIIAIGSFATLHLVLLAYKPIGLASSLAGLAIDLRYLLYFSLVYIGLRLYPKYYELFIKIGVIGAIISLTFAFLQAFILPADILKYIGYSAETISPYLTVDQNNDFIRINSTFRGPNALGAYSVIALSIAAAYAVKYKKQNRLLVYGLMFFAAVALWFSYSRSALVAAFVALAIVIMMSVKCKKLIKSRYVIGAAVAVVIGGLVVGSNSHLVSNIIFHDNPNDSNNVNSNEGHIESLNNGLDKMIRQPIGNGIGSTGSASLFSDQPEIIENHYLFVAHESGWLGLLYFVGIFSYVLFGLWRHKKNWLSLGLFASGIGLALIGLLLPVWVDDTVSIIWWGLAAIILSNLNFGGHNDSKN